MITHGTAGQTFEPVRRSVDASETLEWGRKGHNYGESNLLQTADTPASYHVPFPFKTLRVYKMSCSSHFLQRLQTKHGAKLLAHLSQGGGDHLLKEQDPGAGPHPPHAHCQAGLSSLEQVGAFPPRSSRNCFSHAQGLCPDTGVCPLSCNASFHV